MLGADTRATTRQHRMTVTSDFSKQTIEAGIKDREEAPADTAESASQDMEATTRKADAVSDCALDADKLSAGLSELMHTVDLIYAWLFDKLFNKDKRARDNQG